MRKLHKEQILNTVETLCQACGELVALQGDSLTGLCADMQEFVSAIFDYLNGVQKGRTEELQLQELLQQAYEKLYLISCGDAKVGDMVQLCSWLREAADSLVADEIEIVFFCYKASMSDCFESVYFAAKEDEKCTPYFVPIPYFDRNPDGSFGQMHLEAEEYYSDKYELTDWKTYDVENRRPDAIFIMNPYDGNNLVTSVHPNFYSKRLREFTDKLVYIEYGLPLWVYKEPEKAAETIRRNGVLSPAQVYSHYYIAYSKEMANYFKVYFANMPQVKCDKFVPLGSPKFDKVLNAHREDYSIPDQWKDKIRNKKIVLYNCALGEMLKVQKQNADVCDAESIYFGKVRSIIDAFKGRDDVVLWWRPHPLFESTLQSMQPTLLEEYREIVENFKNTGNGIFDDTQDLNRAIVWSDAMISDESSLLLLYLATGKLFWIPSISKAVSKPYIDKQGDFAAPLNSRLEMMRAAKGANIFDLDMCIWWDAFLEEDEAHWVKYERFMERFFDYVVAPEKYPEAKEYRELQLQMFADFVENADGTAGEKIYRFVKG